MNVEESRLASLFEEIADLSDRQRYSQALKLADAARRFAPENTTARLIHARLLINVGNARAAETILAGRVDRDSLLLHAQAAANAGRYDIAAASAAELLRRFSVDALEELRPTLTRLCMASPGFAGWAGVDSSLRVCGEIPGESVVGVFRNEQCIGEITAESDAGARVLEPFFAQIAPRNAGLLHLRVMDRVLLGSPLTWPPAVDFGGWVVLEGNVLHGEARFNWAPQAPVTLLVGRGPAARRVEVAPLEAGSVGWRFSVTVDLSTVNHDLVVAAVLADGRRLPLTGSPLKLSPPPAPPRKQPPKVTKGTPGRREVNVVLPVYSGLEETAQCLRSVLRTLPPKAVLTVVHDAGPEPGMPALLHGIAADPRVTVLSNAVNLGFPAAVNRGMRSHPDRDVVLLNADTEVFDGWIQRLRAVAYAQPRTGTVTPLGESASIVTYPGSRAAPCTSDDAALIDRLAASANAEVAVEIPVGVGFCLYVRRDCLEDVGEFDEHSFDKGYGEENDFCLRARQLGWQSLAAAGVFVRHVGGRSFGAAKQLLMTRNQRVIEHRYPGYAALIQDFLARHPLQGFKRALDEARLRQAATLPVLIVSLSLPGGVKRHVLERQAALTAAGHSVIVMRGVPDGAGKVTLTGDAQAFEYLTYELPTDLEALRQFLQSLTLHHVELHHFLDLPAAALEMAAELAVPTEIFVHDHAWICPRVSLLNGAGEYCGEPELAACERCVAQHGGALSEPITVAALRARRARLLGAASRVVVPSHDVKTRLLRHFPGQPVEVRPWEAEPPAQPAAPSGAIRTGRVRVLVPGAIGTPKGYEVLLACAQDAVQRDLKLEFVVVGYTRDDAALRATSRVSITGPYEEDELPGLLLREEGDVLWIPSITPETWSYTLTQALRHHLPIVAFDIGAQGARLRDRTGALRLPLSTPPRSMNDALLRLAAPYLPTPSRQNNQYISRDEQRMEAAESSVSPPPDIAATVQMVTLPVGIYAFTVQNGRAPAPGSLALPALQVAPAPMRAAGTIEFLSGPATIDRWLTSMGDVLTARVSGAPVAVLLTSLRAPDSDVLSIDIRRLDAPPPVPPPAAEPAPAPEVTGPRVATRVHLPYVGELEFQEGWAGRPQDNLWIEGFAAQPAEPHESDLIEYCALNEAGEVTEWLSGGQFCGKRGAGVPLVAFAARVKSTAASAYTCHYSGQFLSGSVVGPFTDGRFCRSETEEDPLVALELRLEATAG